ncbi:MAG: FKBP-type peptidyl-prolyl cis-trans isomerase [Polaribacter sp.]|nr:FKBP-type peptidyl-prolyl cis-trans isomerase [Polaribacter sp.]
MKTIKTIIVLFVAVTIVSCNDLGVTKHSLNSEIDSISYALGLDMSNQFNGNFKEVNEALFIQGYKNGMDSSNVLLENKNLDKIIRPYFLKKLEKSNEKTYAYVKKEGEDFLKENKTKKGVQVTKSGLQYIVVKEGKGAHPNINSKVVVHYQGMLIDGTVFTSTIERKKAEGFIVRQVIKGWQEGLQLMKKGARYKLFIPQELAYGKTPYGDKMKPFSALIFEVELLDILK